MYQQRRQDGEQWLLASTSPLTEIERRMARYNVGNQDQLDWALNTQKLQRTDSM